jgi:hypothetical protein
MFPDLNLGIGHFAFMSIRKTLLELFEPAMLINHLISLGLVPRSSASNKELTLLCE